VDGEILKILHFAFMGFLGALLYILVWARSVDDIKSFETARRLAIGTIAGYLYYYLHTQYNLPNLVMSAVAGYAGSDFIEAIFEKLAPQYARSLKRPAQEAGQPQAQS